jgi:hypothetical protein
MDLGDSHYQFTVTTLARISAVFAELPEFHSKYGLKPDGRGKRRAVQELVSSSLKSLSLTRFGSSPSSRLTGVNQTSIEILSNPRLALVGPDLKNEVALLKNSADGLQQMLSMGEKLQWSAIDKAWLEGLVKRLKNYNSSLNKILPVDSNLPIQSG